MSRSPRSRRPHVAIITRWIPHYRVPFYDGLRDALARRGIDLHLVYGVGSRMSAENQDEVAIPWARPVRSWTASGRFGRLVWHHALPHVRSADLVIVPQQTQLLISYPLMAQQLTGRQRMAFWGHGRNFQTWRASIGGEAVKRWMSRRVHWWFAYNELSSQVVIDLGFPRERITVVQNAIDTRALIDARAALDSARLEEVREQYGIDRHRRGRVAVYSGGLYADKRLDMFVASCARIREQVPDFEIVVMGAGTHQHLVEAAAARYPWLHYVGPQFGADKVAFFALARLLLMPGLVGLAVLDAFALETPLVTLADSPHSPEIDYLVDGENGAIVDPTDAEGDAVEAYAATVTRLLLDDAARGRLVAGCRRARDTYTIETMVTRYADGVQAALAAPDRLPLGKRKPTAWRPAR